MSTPEQRVFAGTSAFFANRKGNRNWLDNHNRPFITLTRTFDDGKKAYTDLFLNNQAVSVKVAKNGKVTLTFDSNISTPLFRILDKS